MKLADIDGNVFMSDELNVVNDNLDANDESEVFVENKYVGKLISFKMTEDYATIFTKSFEVFDDITFFFKKNIYINNIKIPNFHIYEVGYNKETEIYEFGAIIKYEVSNE